MSDPEQNLLGHRLALQWMMVMEPGHAFLWEVLLAASNAIQKLALFEHGEKPLVQFWSIPEAKRTCICIVCTQNT